MPCAAIFAKIRPEVARENYRAAADGRVVVVGRAAQGARATDPGALIRQLVLHQLDEASSGKPATWSTKCGRPSV